jgi:MSHA biogenesis protein MshG
MSTFRYRVRDRRGRSITGEMEGSTAQAVSESLGQQGYYPISITKTDTMKMSFGGRFQPKLRSDDLVALTRQLWSLQKAGLPLIAGLTSLKEQAGKTDVKQLIARIIEDLEKGDSLSEAFAHHPKVFRPIYVHMIRAGEASGKLEEVFLQLSDIERFERDTREKIRSATMYPMIALIGIILAFLGVITFVIPRFASLYGKFNAKLPTPTRILLGINDVLQHHLVEAVIVVVLLVIAFRTWVSRPSGRYLFDLFKLKFPVFGKLFFDLQMTRFARVLSDLTRSGVPILQSLTLVAETMGNVILRGAILRVHQSVNEGKGMSQPMKETRLFAPLVVQMMEVGEHTGRVDELLMYVAEYYQDQATMTIKNLAVLIEPMLLAVLGGMVLLLAAGVFTPVWNLVNVIHS